MSTLCKVFAFIFWVAAGISGVILLMDFWIGLLIVLGLAVMGTVWFALHKILDNQEIIMDKLDQLQSVGAGVSAGSIPQNSVPARPRRSALSKLSDIASETAATKRSFDDEGTDSWNCKACGQKNPASTDYCNNCGKFRVL